MGMGFTACSDDDDDEVVQEEPQSNAVEDYTNNYFSIEGADFHEGSMPEATTEEEMGTVSYNDRALTGGMNFIVVNSDKNFQKFLVGIEGQDGYWEYNPNDGRAGSSTYTIPVIYGSGYNQDIFMVIIAVDEQGNVFIHIFKVSHVDSESGDININLTFSTPKDVDLHLYTPSGNHIYYGDRGGSVTINGETVTYGLDHDSNPACNIDNLNNENIYIPAELVENGEYRVVVDMYANCSYSYDCSWAVIARYKGNIIPNELDGWNNPAMGTYAASCGNHDLTTIMKFTITDAENNSDGRSAKTYSVTPRSVTDAELNKIEFEKD